MNCYYFYCLNYKFEYVAVWEDSANEAIKKCISYCVDCVLLSERPENVSIGYLY